MTIKKTLILTLAASLAPISSAIAHTPVTTKKPSGFHLAADLGASHHTFKMLRPSGVDLGAANKRHKLTTFDSAFRFGWMGDANNFLFGFEGGLGYSAGAKSYSYIDRTTRSTGSLKFKKGFNYDVVGKLGMRFDRTSVYGLAGSTWSKFRVEPTGALFGGKKDTKTLHGFTFGGGVMQKLSEKVSIRGEYRHTRFNKLPLKNILVTSIKVQPVSNAFMGGVVFHM